MAIQYDSSFINEKLDYIVPLITYHISKYSPSKNAAVVFLRCYYLLRKISGSNDVWYCVANRCSNRCILFNQSIWARASNHGFRFICTSRCRVASFLNSCLFRACCLFTKERSSL